MTEHRGLHRDHQLARFESECGEAQNLVAVFGDEYFHEAARLGDRFRAQYFGHRQLRHPIFDAVAPRFDFVLTDARQFRIGEHAERDEAIAVSAIGAAQVRVHDAIIIEADVRELWTARAIAHRPDGGPDQVLAWQAGDVRTGATEQPALYNHRSTTAIAGPCGEFA